jgi:type IV secretory pathway TrbL component
VLSAEALKQGSTALGESATASAMNATALGWDSNATAVGGVAIGSNSVASTGSGVAALCRLAWAPRKARPLLRQQARRRGVCR